MCSAFVTRPGPLAPSTPRINTAAGQSPHEVLPQHPACNRTRFHRLEYFRFNNPPHAAIPPSCFLNATTTGTAATTPAQRKADLQRSLALCTQDGLVAMPIVTMS